MIRRSTRRSAGIAAASAVVFLFLGTTPAAAADTPWYFSALKLDAVAAEGFTGEGVTIAVIDGQINPEVPALADANLEIREPSFCYDAASAPIPATTAELSATKPTEHGTNVVSMIAGSGAGYDGQSGVSGVAPGAKILYYSIYTSADENDQLQCADDSGGETNYLGDAMTEALDDGADIISVSLEQSVNPTVTEALARAMREGVVVVGSLPNSSELRVSSGMPARANGAVSVQAAGADGSIQATDGEPNRNSDTDIVAPGLDFTVQGNPATGQWTEQYQADGTSLATPLTAGVLALVMEKYPEATGNQIIQSLISNTGAVAGEPQDYDANELIGYGLISVENMMTDDPAKYDDVNPLILKEAPSTRDVLVPTYEEIFPTETDSPDPTASAEEPADSATGLPSWIWIVVGGFVVFVVIIAVVIVLVVRKSRPSTRTSH